MGDRIEERGRDQDDPETGDHAFRDLELSTRLHDGTTFIDLPRAVEEQEEDRNRRQVRPARSVVFDAGGIASRIA